MYENKRQQDFFAVPPCGQVSFYEEGKAEMLRQIELLKSSYTDFSFGIAIHDIATWYELKD